MIILPDQYAPQGKFFIPVTKRSWITPSLAQPRDQFGRQNQTIHRVKGFTSDGVRRWTAIFDNREDFDAFVFSAFQHSLGFPFPIEDWRLPQYIWGDPDFEPGTLLAVDTVTFLTSSTGSNQTYTSPADWDNAHNTIELLGGGASGAVAPGARHGTGGGGGEYGKTTNFSFATPGTTTATYQIAALAAAVTNSATTNGNAGNASWFNGTTQAGSTLGAIGGTNGVSNTGPQNGGAGGTGGVGTTHNAGGRGGNLTGATGNGGTGGGGAGGSTGAGNNGADSSSTASNVTTAGGSGDAGSGGSAGTAGGTTGGTGGNGTEWDASHGSGGGGGGATNSGGNATSGSGGNYGAGGAGVEINAGSTGTSGGGIQGIIVVTYTPLVASSNSNFFIFFT